MKPDPRYLTLTDNLSNIEQMLKELILLPRRDLAKWAEFTKQTPNIKLGYPGQHLASLVTGVEGARTGARGHDLRDRSEVKSCSRVDQLDKCKVCKAAVARIESTCPSCESSDVKRNKDSKWLFTIKSEEELTTLLEHVPRVVLLLFDYPRFHDEDWETLQLQVFEIWPHDDRHILFREIMKNYLKNIYMEHIRRNPSKTPAPKNFWPDSFQFFMCNPVRTFHCLITEALHAPHIEVLEYVEPMTDRALISPVPMPLSILYNQERSSLSESMGADQFALAETVGLDESQRLSLNLRDTDHASPQGQAYQRGAR